MFQFLAGEVRPGSTDLLQYIIRRAVRQVLLSRLLELQAPNGHFGAFAEIANKKVLQRRGFCVIIAARLGSRAEYGQVSKWL